MRQLKFALIALLPLFLTGCWDGRDPEDRAYVITMGIDKGEDGLLVTFAPAKTTEGNAQSVYRVNGDTLTQFPGGLSGTITNGGVRQKPAGRQSSL